MAIDSDVYITWALKQTLENLLPHHPPVIVKKVKMSWLQQIAWSKVTVFPVFQTPEYMLGWCYFSSV